MQRIFASNIIRLTWKVLRFNVCRCVVHMWPSFPSISLFSPFNHLHSLFHSLSFIFDKNSKESYQLLEQFFLFSALIYHSMLLRICYLSTHTDKNTIPNLFHSSSIVSFSQLSCERRTSRLREQMHTIRMILFEFGYLYKTQIIQLYDIFPGNSISCQLKPFFMSAWGVVFAQANETSFAWMGIKSCSINS